ncbi:penicillin-binding protein [Falcatimonas sp. MSJ-15]|uniref:penicillin-binding transpeptidase domain-containing protein n=1 Tax=Falcatimonas sp. MSJ-15 TaxID=2841515 RepID=UPI001C11C51B|nr:penicillin-binding transpeptidase domain-containing protein [Falcatimonas sp. MSJ-15]MBU5470830.1 penicillin-binding protein [Falcatimonas sp. MSJ-15]
MIKDFFEAVLNVLKSRILVVSIVFVLLFAILINRLYQLQVVSGSDYWEQYIVRIKRDTTIDSTRGNIYDRNGVLLAYNELAFCVVIEDSGHYISTKEKNKKLNDTIYKMITIIEQNGDKMDNDYSIVVNDSGNYEYVVSDDSLLRFLRDAYGHSKVSELKAEEKVATPDDVIEYLCSAKVYGIDQTKYSKADILKIITIRTALSTNAYKRYVKTTVATDVSDETVAAILENSNDLIGVSIEEDYVRRYNHSVEMAHILGYTGKINQEQLDELSISDSSYDLNDDVGKSGIEESMELQLNGKKGSETVYVDNVGRVLETADRVEPEAGNDVYLSIDVNLQSKIYHALEQELADILVSNITTSDTAVISSGSSTKVQIPIKDVYYALINNNVLSMSKIAAPDGTDTEQNVYAKFLDKRDTQLEVLREELTGEGTAYKNLSEEMEVYIYYIYNMLLDNNVIVRSEIDETDETYQAWNSDELSLSEILKYYISMNWVDLSAVNTDVQYSSLDETYNILVDYIINTITDDSGFAKKLYKFLIKDGAVTGREVCLMLYEQGILDDADGMYESIQNGASTYDFMINKISSLEITPAQLALDPCSGSCVVTNSNTGEVLAMVSYPSYDNNEMSGSIDAAYYSMLLNDASKPLLNRATTQTLAPGSTYKMISSITGLEEGVIGRNEVINCEGIFKTVTPSPKCWIYPSAHGATDVERAIEVSCNYFFYEVGYRLSFNSNGDFDNNVGLEKLKKYATMFGLGEKSGVEVYETEPKISDNNSISSAIGQGSNSYSAIQLAKYVTAIANSGTCYNLTLLDKVVDSSGNVVMDCAPVVYNQIQLSNSTWTAVHEGMRRVITEASKSTFSDLPIAVAGKSGTAQQEEDRANHATFVAYAPYENPEIGISVQLPYAYSSSNSALMCKKIVQLYYGIEDNGSTTISTSNSITD